MRSTAVRRSSIRRRLPLSRPSACSHASIKGGSASLVSAAIGTSTGGRPWNSSSPAPLEEIPYADVNDLRVGLDVLRDDAAVFDAARLAECARKVDDIECEHDIRVSQRILSHCRRVERMVRRQAEASRDDGRREQLRELRKRSERFPVAADASRLDARPRRSRRPGSR